MPASSVAADEQRDRDSANSDEDSCQGAAMNLLDIRNPQRWDASARADDAWASKSSDAPISKIYQPKFVEVFTKYSESLPAPIDLSQHLMAICLDHLATFCCWARESASRIAWIKATLDENGDLRPEVRNGLSVIFIYCVSAVRAEALHAGDMFLALQEPDTGLGIVNKTSLKIYNDPFGYFEFLKSCISGLIDAGRVPENERQNQPKKAKRQTENREEVQAFDQLRGVLVRMLSIGDNAGARSAVQLITETWHLRSKSIRTHRFAAAVAAIMGATGGAGAWTATGLGAGVAASGPALLPKLSEFDVDASMATPFAPSSSGAQQSPADSQPTKAARTSLSSTPGGQRASIPALRFQRVAASEWEFQESRVFGPDALVQAHGGTLCLVDESRLAPQLFARRLGAVSNGLVSLPAELQRLGALVTSWPPADHSHMLAFLESWLAQQEAADPASLLQLWHAQQADQRPAAGGGAGRLVYETTAHVGIVLRKCESLGVSEDCWRMVFPEELQAAATGATLDRLFASLFPQLRRADELPSSRVVVKYLAHRGCGSAQAPRAEPAGMYQTAGTLSDPAATLLCRMDSDVAFHDVVLSLQ